jgi:transposase
MEDTSLSLPLPDDVNELKRLLSEHQTTIAQQQATIVQQTQRLAQQTQTMAQQSQTITQVTQQRDEFYQQKQQLELEKLRLELRLAKALKQAYGPRADRVSDLGQLLLDFGQLLDQLPISAADLPAEEEAPPEQPRVSRRLRTRGRRDLSQLEHLPLFEHNYELTPELCRCPTCQNERQKIGAAISFTIEYLPSSFVRIKHIQHKYACRQCEQNGDNPNITLAAKTGGSPIDKGLPGPGLLAYVVTSKFSDFLPLHRLQHIFARQGFELDRSTMCLWMADVAHLVRPLYQRMVQGVLQSHVLATDDTVMPLLQPGKARQARMWIYQGDEAQPYNVFDFTLSRARDGPAQFLKDFRGTLLADAYGGYDGIVLNQDLPRAGCWAHARRKFVEAERAAPAVVRAIVQLINRLFALEARLKDAAPDERLQQRQAQARPLLDALHALLLEQKTKLVPKHPVAQAMAYVLNQWPELTLFLGDPAVPIHNNLAEQQMKRIALLRKNALFVATQRGGETAAILSSFTSTCRRHEINPQLYLTQLLANLPDTPISRIDEWLPDEWKKRQAQPAEASPAED